MGFGWQFAICNWQLAIECGGLAQLARAPALQAGGQRFESVILHFRNKRMGEADPSRDTVAAMFRTIYDMLHKNSKV